MTSKNFEQLLIDLKACKEAREWAKGKTWNKVFKTCHRGDWLLWLFQKTNPNDLRTLTLAKGHCAATVLHLMKDERSKLAVQAAIDFGNFKITIEQLKNADYAAYHAYDATYTAVACVDYDITGAYAAYAAYAAADAYAYAAATAATAAADHDAKKKNQKITADIVRQYIPIEKWKLSV